MTLAEMNQRHLREWDEFRRRFGNMEEEKEVKLAKAIGDVIKLMQENERRIVQDSAASGDGSINVSWVE